MPYQHLFFDLDHTIWDFEMNSKETLWDLHQKFHLAEKGIDNFDTFYDHYSVHNHRLWDRYTKGFIKQEELRWKRIYLSLLDFKIADETLSRAMSVDYLDILPNKTNLFPYTIEILDYLKTLDKAKATIDESIMIGDNEAADIQGAINIGMDSVFVNHINAVPTVPATYTITHLKELENIL